MLAFSFEGFDDVQRRLQLILQRTGTLQPLLREIGEDFTNDAKNRFVTATDPYGNPWQPNSPVTLAHKSGSLPLTDGGSLADSIAYKIFDDGRGVEIGSNMDQAAMMQFGGTKAEFPHLWGDIPARPFLGISDADIQHVLALSEYYFLKE